MPEKDDRVVIGTVAGSPMYGTQAEATAAKLPCGSKVRVMRRNGDVIRGELVKVWLFDGPMFDVKLDCGGEATFSFDLGDVIEPLTKETEDA